MIDKMAAYYEKMGIQDPNELGFSQAAKDKLTLEEIDQKVKDWRDRYNSKSKTNSVREAELQQQRDKRFLQVYGALPEKEKVQTADEDEKPTQALIDADKKHRELQRLRDTRLFEQYGVDTATKPPREHPQWCLQKDTIIIYGKHFHVEELLAISMQWLKMTNHNGWQLKDRGGEETTMCKFLDRFATEILGLMHEEREKK